MNRMPDSLTCEMVDERDLDTRYLTGKLDEAEAAAFEAHYFGCDRCWALVRGGAEVRASAGGPPHSLGIRLRVAGGPGWWVRRLALLAAAVVLVASALTLGRRPRRGAETTIRGAATAIDLHVRAHADTSLATWGRVEGAESYRVRLYAADGSLLSESETPDTVFALPGSQRPPSAGELLLQVAAQDRGREVLAQSGLVSVPHDSAP